MIPTSAVRETLILIIFGIILVPIAAKRAQDARGYWQTFQLHDLATSTPPPPAYDPLLVTPSLRHDGVMKMAANVMPAQNETLPAVFATSSAPRAETRMGLTIHFGSATAAGEPMATAEPRGPLSPPQQPQQFPRREAEELPIAAKASNASRGRWTLIWMGSAIAAVAVFMSLC